MFAGRRAPGWLGAGFWVVLSVGLWACGESTLERPLPPSGHARFRLQLSSVATPAEVQSMVVTVSRVTAWSSALGWVTVSRKHLTVDLLATDDSGRGLPLGFADLPEGEVRQIRLYLATDAQADHHLLLSTGAKVPLQLPPALESGIKIEGPFPLRACDDQEVRLRLDGGRSLKSTDDGRTWLRPVVLAEAPAARRVGCTTGKSRSGTSEPAPSDDAPLSRNQGNTQTSSNNQQTSSSSNSGSASSTGTAPPSTMGNSCSSGAECLSGSCVDGHCMQSGAHGACAANRDCVSLSCVQGECAPGAVVSAGSDCSDKLDCMSGACNAGACMPGLQGAGCWSDGDCEEGLTCAGETCSPQIN